MRDQATVNFCCCAECCVAHRYVNNLLLRGEWEWGDSGSGDMPSGATVGEFWDG